MNQPYEKGQEKMARIAIKTKYLGPTYRLGARIKATAMDSYETINNGKPLTITKPLDYSYSTEQAHLQVAEELIQPLYNPSNYSDVSIKLTAGATETGYVFVATNDTSAL
jgi:hypothetical protein